MKKNDEMRAEYKREDLGVGVRGKHFAAYQQSNNVVLIKPELAKLFTTSEAVNQALESLVAAARKVPQLQTSAH